MTATTTLVITAQGEEIIIEVASTDLEKLTTIFITNGVAFQIA